jgi:alpha-beta hydrolase superfamily lysophospholipase
MTPSRSDFVSRGIRCAGWLYLPAAASSGSKPAVVVLAHGFSGTHAFHYWHRAEAYAEAGYAVFDFDFRHLGDSDGSPRQIVSVRKQREDLLAALSHVRSLPEVDPSRIALYGTSLGGGLVVDVASQDHGVAAVIAIVPYLDGLAAAPGTPLGTKVRLVQRALADKVGRLRGRAPMTMRVFGQPGSDSVMDRDGAWDLLPTVGAPGSDWDTDRTVLRSTEGTYRNEATRFEILEMALYRPGRRLGR